MKPLVNIERCLSDVIDCYDASTFTIHIEMKVCLICWNAVQ